MQDGASCHECPVAIDYLKSKCLILPGWSPNSPDLNQFEIIWSIMKQKIKSQKSSNIFEFEKIVQSVWTFLNETQINDLINDFKKRLELVKQVGRRSISQYISSHQLQAMKQDIYDNLPGHFSTEEDELIIEKVQFLGTKWKKISTFFPSRTSNQIRNRYRYLARNTGNAALINRIEGHQ
jgi:hypothetical protein